MTGAKREELVKAIKNYNLESTPSRWRNLLALLDSLTVLEISEEEWVAHPWAGCAVVALLHKDRMTYSASTMHGMQYKELLTIPRPAPARLTDAEIEERAREAALKEFDKVSDWDDEVDNRRNIFDTLDTYIAVKARLEKERDE